MAFRYGYREELRAIAPRRKLERKLEDEGRAKVRVDVTFTATGGEPNSESATLKLKQRSTEATRLEPASST